MKKKDTQNLLKTKVADLIPNIDYQIIQARRLLGESATETAVQKLAEERVEKAAELRLQLEKPLGTFSRPFPMTGIQRVDLGNGIGLENVLSAIASDSNPLMVYSDRTYEEVVALAYCDMPVPSMLPMFYKGLERRRPESTNRAQMIISDPGHGKSFMGAHHGRLKSREAVNVIDCGGKNMNEILFEMVLDFGASDSLPQAIDKKLMTGKIEAISLNMLEQLNSLETMPDIVKQAAAEEQAEWQEKQIIVTKTDDGRLIVDWEKLRTGGEEKITKAYEILQKISTVEGLDKAGGNTLGINSQYGDAIRRWMNGEEVVYDEYSKSLEGGDNKLQTFWQFAVGEINYCRVENPFKNKDNTQGPAYFEFKREDQKAGFFITLTDNKAKDGSTTRVLNQSVYDRLQPDTLPDPDAQDWQHRICQMMTGIPVSTLYKTFKESADAAPQEFGDWLLELRRTKANMSGTAVPEFEETLLKNWQRLNSATEKLAKFMYEWSEMTSHEKILSNGNHDLIEEIDEEYSKKEAMSFRRITKILEDSLPIRPEMEPYDQPLSVKFGRWNKSPKLSEKIDENLSLFYGSRLVRLIEDMAYQKAEAMNKPRLYQKLLTAMEKNGLREINLMEGAHSHQQSVEQSLNISAFSDNDPAKRAELARKVLCNYLRQTNPAIRGTDEDIVTVKRVQAALSAIEEKNTAETKELHIVNRDPETLLSTIFTAAAIRDAALYESAGKKNLDFGLDDLVNHDDFLASLTLPTLGAKNLAAVWENNLSSLWKESETSSAPSPEPSSSAIIEFDESLDIARNSSKYGLGITTVHVLHHAGRHDEVVPVHIIQDHAHNKTLIISEKAPAKLSGAFKEAGIIHIDRNDPSAKAKIDAAMRDMVRGLPTVVKQRLTQAFMYRNSPANTDSLSGMLIDKNTVASFAKYVVRSK